MIRVTKEWALEHLPLQCTMEAYGWAMDPSTEDMTPFEKVRRFNIPFGSSVINRSLPPVVYPNRDGRNECMVASFASALHHLGYHDEAATIAKGYEEEVIRNDSSQMEGFRNLVLDAMSKHGGGSMRLRRPDPLYQPFNIAHRTSNPIWASIRAHRLVGGKWEEVNVAHCICFVGNLVFDSNMKTALPISQKSLDLVCSKIEPGVSFAGIHQSRVLVINKKDELDKKKKLRMLMNDNEVERLKRKNKQQRQRNSRKKAKWDK
jgi:hypothetical protein